MKTGTTTLLTGLLLIAAGASAEDSIVGRYNGSITSEGINARTWSVSILITSVEGGVITGTGIRDDPACRGEYPLRGKLRGNHIGVRAIQKGGPAGDCGFGFRGTVQDGALVGKYLGKRDLELRK